MRFKTFLVTHSKKKNLAKFPQMKKTCFVAIEFNEEAERLALLARQKRINKRRRSMVTSSLSSYETKTEKSYETASHDM